MGGKNVPQKTKRKSTVDIFFFLKKLMDEVYYYYYGFPINAV